MTISRREALLGTVLGGLAGCATSFDAASFTANNKTQGGTFAHGVASGDPDRESIVLWTRITTTEPTVAVSVQVAEDNSFDTIVFTQKTETSGARDHTVKVIADGLTPGKTYYYRFLSGDDVSPVGRMKTLPEKTEKAAFAVCSCSNYPFGYFNAYDHMARRTDIDAVVHLGDYIYEYGIDGYGAEEGVEMGRLHEPNHEILTLSDYRRRHAQYKSDPSSQAVHAAHPFIVVWDDHETANNSWEGGAENHTPETEGSWDARRNAAMQAYYEWMPVRDPEPGKTREALYREYNWGGLLTMVSIETRLTARGIQLEYDDIVPTLKNEEDIENFRQNVLGDPSRQMLGDAQLSYLSDALSGSVNRGEPWRFVNNQVIMARLMAPNLGAYVSEEQIVEFEKEWKGVRAFIEFTKFGLPLNLDAWDGYPAARQRFYEMAQKAGAKDLVVVTGDTHEAWANDLIDDNDVRMGVELGTTSVTSPDSRKYLGAAAADYSLLLRKENRDIRFHDNSTKGYLTVFFDGDKAYTDYVAISTITEPTYDASITARFDLIKRNGSVELSAPKGLGFKERVLF